MCSPSVLLDLPVGIFLPCVCSALSSSFIFFWYPLSHVVGPLAWFFGDWGFDTYRVTLSYCIVDRLLLMLSGLWVTWEAGLKNLNNVIWWPPSPISRGKGPAVLFLSGLNLSHGYSLHLIVLKYRSHCQARLISDSCVFPGMLLTYIARNRRPEEQQQLAL